MFNTGIFRKTFLDSLPAVLAVMVGLVAFVILFVWAMLNMGTELLNFVSKFPFLQKMFEMSLGIRVDGEVSVNILFAVCFTHLMALMLCWSVIIATATRVTVGEFERGTADLLLTLPVGRSEVYLTTSLVWILIATVVSFVPLLGLQIATLIFQPEEEVFLSKFVAPACNFVCLNLAIGGMSMLAGCVFARRGMAISFIVGVVFVSVVLNFIEPFVSAMENIAHLSLLKYYRPVDIVRLNEWPIGHMVFLSAIGVVSWVTGMIIYCRKDVPTA